MKAEIILSLLALSILCVGCWELLDSSNGDELHNSTGEEVDTVSEGEQNILYPPPTGPVKIEQAAKVAAQAVCSRMERCRVAELDGSLYKNEFCIQHFTRNFEDSYDLSRASIDGRILWDEKKMGRCLEDYALTECDINMPTIILPCLSIVSNAQPEQACLTSDECVNDHRCDESQSCPGICVARRGENENCNDGTDQCASGLTCEDGTCLPILEQGEECNEAGGRCANGLYCEMYEGYDHTGSCEPPNWIYDELEPGQECQNYNYYDKCKGDYFCVPVNIVWQGYAESQCQMPLNSGARCIRDDYSLRDPCPVGEYCRAENDVTWGTCTPRRSIGELCDQENSCVKGVSCDRPSNTCVVSGLNRLGETCEGNYDCYSQNCNWDTKTCEHLIDCY